MAPKEYTISLSEADISLIGRALGDLPFRDVHQLIAKLNNQLQTAAKDQPKTPTE